MEAEPSTPIERVLVAHSRYSQFGGEDASTAAEIELLRSRGIDVVTYVKDNEEIESYGPARRVGLAARTVWSRETYRDVIGLARETKVDVAHFHNTFPLLSPSGYSACRSAGIPVVQTLRNFRLFCVNGLFFRDGHVCEDCIGRTPPWPGVLHACYRSSRPQSAVIATMQTVHRGLRTWTRNVDAFIVPSHFLKTKLVEGGLPAELIEVKPNVLGVQPRPATGAHRYGLYVGRISPEKGVGTLLRAWARVTAVPLKIVGDGPARSEAEELAKDLGLGTSVEFLGEKTRDDVHDLMERALFVVVPSESYETFGRVGLEALTHGTPVIASRLGALEETIREGTTGLHFGTGDAQDLAAKILWALEHPEAMRAMGEAGREEVRNAYSDDANFTRLMTIYERARDKAGRSQAG
ncbi:MAG TPA: glycosyltransferase family 4 protein [Actinomycetota bacterium]|nr:glycosyltransferase family 4 protein [Actinomycetota bacterium]